MQIQRDPMTASMKIVEAVADAKGVEVTDLRPPLSEVIDPDALNTLFTDAESGTIHVSFHYSGYDVTIESDGAVDVREPESRSNNST